MGGGSNRGNFLLSRLMARDSISGVQSHKAKHGTAEKQKVVGEAVRRVPDRTSCLGVGVPSKEWTKWTKWTKWTVHKVHLVHAVHPQGGWSGTRRTASTPNEPGPCAGFPGLDTGGFRWLLGCNSERQQFPRDSCLHTRKGGGLSGDHAAALG